ncbi:hypothetical protein [Pseudoxanthomonas jiangsuensis]|uniref:hypothetical protein n=1 Tax=Pseudoxanthomonas jiangsuensis TaxID=619688 RepID=UPI001390CA74|nr:hypothetical protein [Pseudoxanthomonas jiangsuensis]
MNRFHQKVFGWLSERVALAFSFLLGVVAGITVCAPLVGFSLRPEASDIIGAALGALLAIAGAVLISQREERNRRNTIRVLAGHAVDMVIPRINTAYRALLSLQRASLEGRAASIDICVEDFLAELHVLRSMAAVCLDQFEKLRDAYFSAGVEAASVHYHVVDSLRTIVQSSEFLSKLPTLRLHALERQPSEIMRDIHDAQVSIEDELRRL